MEDKPDFEKLAREQVKKLLLRWQLGEGGQIIAVDELRCFGEKLWTSHVLPLKKDYTETKDRNIKLWEENHSLKQQIEELKKENERLKAKESELWSLIKIEREACKERHQF